MQNPDQQRGPASDWKNNSDQTCPIETCVFGIMEIQLRAPRKPPVYLSTVILKGLREVLNCASIMPTYASLLGKKYEFCQSVACGALWFN